MSGEWVALAVVGALLALDDTALGQTWLSLPAAAGVLTGLVLGRPDVGLAVGVLVQCVSLGNLPVGVTFTVDPVTAVVGVTGGAVLAGWAPELGDTARWGWLLLAGCVFSLAGHWGLEGERRAHLAWMLEGARTLRDGKLARIERLHGACLVLTAVRGGLLTLAWAALVRWVWVPAYDALPASFERALGWLAVMAPAMAVGTVIERYGWRSATPTVAGVAGVAILVVWLV